MGIDAAKTQFKNSVKGQVCIAGALEKAKTDPLYDCKPGDTQIVKWTWRTVMPVLGAGAQASREVKAWQPGASGQPKRLENPANY